MILEEGYDLFEKTPLFIINREISRTIKKLTKNA